MVLASLQNKKIKQWSTSLQRNTDSIRQKMHNTIWQCQQFECVFSKTTKQKTDTGTLCSNITQILTNWSAK